MGYNKSLDFLNMIKNGGDKTDVDAFRNAKPLEDVSLVSKTQLTRNASEPPHKTGPILKTTPESEIHDVQDKAKAHVKHKAVTASSQFSLFAVIDSETNWHDEVMSLGVAIADKSTFKCLETRYYIFEQEARIGGMYSSVLYKCTNGTAFFSEGAARINFSGGSGKESEAYTAVPVTVSRERAMADLSDYLSSKGITSIYAYNAKFDCGHLPELNDFEWYDIMRIAAYKQFNKVIPDTAPCCKTGRLKSNYGVEPITRMLTGNSRYYEVHNAVADAVDELRIVELLGLPLTTYDIARINS